MEADGEGCSFLGQRRRVGEDAGFRGRDFHARPDEDALVPFFEFEFHGLIRK